MSRLWGKAVVAVLLLLLLLLHLLPLLKQEAKGLNKWTSLFFSFALGNIDIFEQSAFLRLLFLF